MSKIVYRPRTTKRRASSKDEFELCYIRHKYFRKTLYNPTVEEMNSYEAIIKNFSRKTCWTYGQLLSAVGFGLEDVENIGRIHLISFLGLFSLESDMGKYSDFVSTYEKTSKTAPQAIDLLDKNRANFTLFLRQRMEELIRICRQKVKNIRGVPMDTGHFFMGPKPGPKDIKKLLEDHSKYGFKKIDPSIFRTARKRSGHTDKNKFKFKGKWYVTIPALQKTLEFVDFSGSGQDPYDSIHNMNPEQVLFHKEEESFWEQKKADFASASKDDKIKMISQFVKNNSENPTYKEEIQIAEKYLRKLGVDLE